MHDDEEVFGDMCECGHVRGSHWSDAITCIDYGRDGKVSCAGFRLKKRYAERELEMEIERLRECLRIAGLQAFMRDKSPEEIAAHMRYVMDANDAENQELREEIEKLRGFK